MLTMKAVTPAKAVWAGVGDVSLKRCHQLVERALANDRSVRMLYVSDFDPSGFICRWWRRGKSSSSTVNTIWIFNSVRSSLHTISAKSTGYSGPLSKRTVNGKDIFEERFGEGATELDATSRSLWSKRRRPTRRLPMPCSKHQDTPRCLSSSLPTRPTAATSSKSTISPARRRLTPALA